jgi:RHS repeat-associated protein
MRIDLSDRRDRCLRGRSSGTAVRRWAAQLAALALLAGVLTLVQESVGGVALADTGAPPAAAPPSTIRLAADRMTFAAGQSVVRTASTDVITDTNGAVTGTASYEPCGKVTSNTGARSAFGFSGNWTDPSTGLVYLRARDYDPATGQFLTVDPLVDTTLQPYAYAGNNPLQATDPTGEIFGLDDLVALGVGAVTGGVTSIVSQEISTGHVDWNDVLYSTTSGALAADAGLNCTELAGPIAGGACAGAAYNALYSIQDQMYRNGDICWSAVGKSALQGAATGAALGGLGKLASPLSRSVIGRLFGANGAVAADSEVLAASKALSGLPKAARNSEKPPGFNPGTWQWRAGSRNNVGMDWWDPKGGEWRYHPADKYHDPHFDYNSWTQWNSPWQHLYEGN